MRKQYTPNGGFRIGSSNPSALGTKACHSHDLMVTGLQLALHSASAETRHELVFAKSLARAPDALNPSLNLILLDLDLPDVDPHDPLSGLRVLYQRVPETPIAIFSANESPASEAP